MPQPNALPDRIRVSIGTAVVLGLAEAKLDAAPTTAYLMTYSTDKCRANCGFCPQAKGSKSSAQLLSRVTWPIYPTAQVIAALATAVGQKRIQRVCIQTLNYPDVFDHLEAVVSEIKGLMDVPVSVSCQPQAAENVARLKAAGVDRLGIALDGATKAVFDQVKGGCYCWETQFRLFREALAVFGEGNVSTHVIVGLGETEREVVEIVGRCVDLGVLPALFAFTPVRGTALERNSPPELAAYRRLQLARYLIVNGKTTPQNMTFDGNGRIVHFGLTSADLETIIASGAPFQTSGCPHCNRPYYNEKPSGPIYNYPKKLSGEEIRKTKALLGY
ncbi:MAG: radical SAM protein [Candidatus Bathyarchaeota archaeon]|nr:radical SAM protein [Candidatus Bathyarchaeota archaeon]